jgi:hypothetical protein
MIKFKISGWYIFVSIMLLTIFNVYLNNMYIRIHEAIFRDSIKVSSYLESLKIQKLEGCANCQANNRNLDEIIVSHKNLVDSNLMILGDLGTKIILSIVAFILAIHSIFCKPKWLAFVNLPIAGYFILYGHPVI